MAYRGILGLVILGCFLGRFGVEDKLLSAALDITAIIASYTFLTYSTKKSGYRYAPPYLVYAVGFVVAAVGVALFVEATHPIGIFAGWEMVSMAGWGLIAFGHRVSKRSLEAAFIAFLTNRLGDAFWLTGVFSGAFPAGVWISVLIKAGIFPFTFWLVQAMIAPAPVSALLHSALLVGMAVYLPIRYPDFVRSPLPDWGQTAVWIASLGASLGAVFSRSPKVTLAWTTSAHLGIALYLVSQPALALSYLIHHSYLKAALFLLLDLARKGKGFSLTLTLLWWLASALLFVSEAAADQKLLPVEFISAIALGQAWARTTYNQSGEKFPLAELVVSVLIFLAAFHMKGLSWQGMLSLAGLLIGAWRPMPMKLRLDIPAVRIMQISLKGWTYLSQWACKVERQLNMIVERIARKFIAIGNASVQIESLLVQRGWPQAAQAVRQGLASLSGNTHQQAYVQALRWSFLLTLIIGMAWKLLR